jgi:UDP-N-acetylglucosamine 4,6-dehydratase
MLNAGAVTLPLTHKEMTRFLLTLEQATNLIEDAYNSPVSHGKIAIPKVSSLKILDVANVLVSVYATDRKVDIVEVGIRPGEKLHEEMISEEEWLRSEEYDTHFLIGQKMVTSELRSYNSFDSLLDPSTTYDFLKMSGVFNV